MKRDLLVFSLSLAKRMMGRGFPVINITENKDYSRKLVFYFANTPEAAKTLADLASK